MPQESLKQSQGYDGLICSGLYARYIDAYEEFMIVRRRIGHLFFTARCDAKRASSAKSAANITTATSAKRTMNITSITSTTSAACATRITSIRNFISTASRAVYFDIKQGSVQSKLAL